MGFAKDLEVPRAAADCHTSMKRSSLVATLLSCSFTLQLMLAGTGTTCVMPGGGADTMAPSANAGMDMAGMTNMPAGEHAPTPSDERVPMQAPCDQPSSPGTCQVMAPCSGGFVVIAFGNADKAADPPSGVVSAIIIMPPSPDIQPKLPPPRA